ncbi:MAG TPA: hypothetical protein VJB16_03760 [archaeon]|nr:hypothetical protein [archaeon]
MDVKQLQERLGMLAGPAQMNQLLTSVSHWIRTIFLSPEGLYIAKRPEDNAMLEKLAGLGLVELKEGDLHAAALTDAGRALYRDFLAHGYY